MTNQNRRGVAYHEAAHAVVGWALGLDIGEIKIRDDDNSGTIEIQLSQEHLPLIDRIAICVASMEAKTIFGFTMHEGAEIGDHAKVIRLVRDLDENASLVTRNAGHNRARELLEIHKSKVHRVAEYLIINCKIDRDTAGRLLGLNMPMPALH
jgi:ATP-dependent Zn protease